MTLPAPSRDVEALAWHGQLRPQARSVAEETPVALSYNRLSHAVMMATPADLADFAVGFSLTEGIVANASEIEELDVVAAGRGLELRMWIGAEKLEALQARRRTLAGPTGCGLCGLESLEQAVRVPPPVCATLRIAAGAVQAAMAALPGLQRLNQQTHAVHAAGFWQDGSGLVAVREDVGRHNALDKLAGALARGGVAGGSGMVLMTSRISVELVQKAAVIGTPVLAAVSAPTRLAIAIAEAAGITLIGVARPDGFEVFTHSARLTVD